MHDPHDPYGVSDIWSPDDIDGPTITPPTEHNDTTTGQPASIPVVARSFDCVRFDNLKDNVPKPSTMKLPELHQWLKGLASRSLVDVDATGLEKKQGAAFSPCRYVPDTTRAKDNVVALSCFAIDLDNVDDAGMADVFARLEGLTAFAWTTWGSGWAKLPQSWRVVVPLAADVDASDWPAVWALLTDLYAPTNDTATKDASRVHLLPCAPRLVPDGGGGQRVNGAVRWREQHGRLLDPAPFIDEARQQAAEDAAAAEKAEAARQAARALTPSRSLANRTDRVTRATLWAAAADRAIQGQGGSAITMRVAGGVVRGFDLPEGEAMQALATWNARCVPPWPPEELRRKVNEADGTPDPKGRPRGYLLDEDRPMPAKSTPPTKMQRRASGASGSVDVGENAANDDDANDDDEDVDDTTRTWRAEMATARADIEAATGSTSSARDTPCEFVSYADLMRLDIPPLRWLVSGVVTADGVFAIAGEPKAAKTWLAVELAVAVALGEKFVGEFATGTPRPVFLFLTEDHADSVRRRLRGTVRGHAKDDDASPPIHVKSRGSLAIGDIDAVAWLVASVRRSGVLPGFVLIDPLRNVLGSLKENDNDDMDVVNKHLRAIRDVLGCAVGYVHHTAKSSEASQGRRAGQRMRGGGALHGGYDSGIHLSAPTSATVGGITVMAATVEVEVKAGKSAAPFGVELRIHDDHSGHCVRADWTFMRQIAAMQAADEIAVMAVFNRADAKERYGKTELATLAGGRRGGRFAAIDKLVEQGRLATAPVGRTVQVRRADHPPDEVPDGCSSAFPPKGVGTGT